MLDWPSLRLGEADLASHFNGRALNVGVLLGDPSGGLVDVDLDCPAALELAPRFLPATGSVFGRASRPRAHFLYRVTPAIDTEQFEDADGQMLLEIRSSGHQTIFPGSTHPSGERITWSEDGDPASLDAEALRQAAATLAVACLFARHWPAPGSRHAAALAAAGILARGGLDEARAVLIVHSAACAAGDEEAAERRRDVVSTVAKVRAGEAVTGGPTLADVLAGDGQKAVRLIRRWLRLTAIEDECVTLTDSGNAQRFAAQHGDDVRYCHGWSTWLVWTGQRWQRDEAGRVVELAKATARSLYAEAAAEPDPDRRKALGAWARQSESEPALRRMLALAQSVHGIPIAPTDMDADPWLLNCPNGTLQLLTGHLRPHRPTDYCTKITAAPYEPAARVPLWERFLEDAVPDPGARAYAQRYAGYSLTGSTQDEVFVFVRGPAGGGKSTFTESLRRTWGDYATTADFSAFLVKKPSDGPSEHVARLAGARLVTSVETRDGQQLAEGLVKLLTGGDTVPARRLYERTFEFIPRFKLLLASNFRPRANPEDDGLWRRLRELPFPTARPRHQDRDERVKATLTDPAQAGPAILAWAGAGCAQWLTEGLGEPEAVMRATREYRAAMEPLAAFVADCCVLDPARSVSAQALRAEYECWCRTEGVKHPLAGRAWGAALRSLGCRQRRTGTGRWWDALDIRDPGETSREPGEDESELFPGMTGMTQ